MSEWQKIETCPMGQEVLVYSKARGIGHYVGAMKGNGDWLAFGDTFEEDAVYPPDFWMPLPTPPGSK